MKIVNLVVAIILSISFIGCSKERASYEDVLKDYCTALQEGNEEKYKELIYPSNIKNSEATEVIGFSNNIKNKNKEKWGDNPKLTYNIVNLYDKESSEVKRYLESSSTKTVFENNNIKYDDAVIIESKIICNESSINARFVMLKSDGEWYIARLVPFEE